MRGEVVSKRGDVLLLVSSALTALLPKCPLCVFALLGATGAAGTAAAVWMPAVMTLSLLLAVGGVWLRARGQQRVTPAVIAMAVALVILAGRFVFDSDAVVYTGAAALFLLAIADFATERMVLWHKRLAK